MLVNELTSKRVIGYWLLAISYCLLCLSLFMLKNLK